MMRAESISTGESLVNVSEEERVRLNNKEITPEIAKLFLLAHKLPVTVEFSKRQTKKRWGSAWSKTRRMVLYRHTVWMFLHELAHIIAGNNEGHSRMFAIVLQGLYSKWTKLEGGTTS